MREKTLSEKIAEWVEELARKIKGGSK